MQRTPKELPQLEAKKLVELREAGPSALPQLRARVAALRSAGWSLAAVGAPLGANRSTTRMWQMSALPADVKKTVKDAPPTPVPAPANAVKVVRKYPEVPTAERDELIRLAESARKIRGWTAPESTQRKDAAEFEHRIRTYNARGVPIKRIADTIGVTHHAIAARLQRASQKVAS